MVNSTAFLIGKFSICSGVDNSCYTDTWLNTSFLYNQNPKVINNFDLLLVNIILQHCEENSWSYVHIWAVWNCQLFQIFNKKKASILYFVQLTTVGRDYVFEEKRIFKFLLILKWKGSIISTLAYTFLTKIWQSKYNSISSVVVVQINYYFKYFLSDKHVS